MDADSNRKWPQTHWETSGTWRRSGGDSQSPAAAWILTPAVHSHQCPVVEALWRRVSTAPCEQYLSRATRWRQWQLHSAALWRTQRDKHLHVLQRTHDGTRRRAAAVSLQHQVRRRTWTQTPATNKHTNLYNRRQVPRLAASIHTAFYSRLAAPTAETDHKCIHFTDQMPFLLPNW